VLRCFFDAKTNRSQTLSERDNWTRPVFRFKQLKECLARGRPFGDERWVEKTAARLGLQYTLNPRGRPRTEEEP
jgi:putative transposase